MSIGFSDYHLPRVPCRGNCGTYLCPHCDPDLLCGACRERLAGGEMMLEGWDNDFLLEQPRGRKRAHSPFENALESDEPPPQRARVAKRVENVFVPPPPTTLGFIYEIVDVGDVGAPRWLVQMEAIDTDTFVLIWRTVLLPDARRIVELVAGKRFEDVWFKLEPDDRALLYRLHIRYVLQLLGPEASGKTSLIQFLVTPEPDELEVLRKSHWYEFTLGQPVAYLDVEEDGADDLLAACAVLELDFEADPPLVSRRISQLVPSFFDNVLKALHLPQANPEREDAPQPEGDGDGDGGGGGGGMDAMRNRMVKAVTRLRDRLLDFADELFPGPFAPLLAPAGVPLRMPPPGRGLRVDTSAARYHAAPNDNAMPPAQMPNPMLPGAGQPFVGVLNIGQGNLNVLYGNHGRVVCYFDFGFATPFHHGTAPRLQYAPCLHDDPQIILSSWDWDHCSLARRVRTVWHLRWIAPQQNVGPAVIQQIYARIVASAAGGSMNIWPGAAAGAAVPQHLPLPWGYVERGLAGNQITDRNEGGLAMYVCVSSPGVAPLGAPAAASNAVLPRAGAAPPATQANAAAAAARAAAMGLGMQALVQAVADAADVATRTFAGFVGVAPAPGDIARAAIAAVGALIARGAGGWTHAMQAMNAIGAVAASGTVNTAAGLLLGAYPPAGLLAATAAASLGVGGVPAAIAGLAMGGPPPTHMEIAVTLAIADAAVAALAGGAMAAPAAALAAVTAVAAPAALNAGGAAAMAPAPNPAVAATIAARQIDAQLSLVAACGAGSAAEAMVANGGAPAFAAGLYASAAAAAVARVIASDGNWIAAFEAVSAAGGGAANAIIAAHAAGGPFAGAVLPAATPSMAARIPAAALAAAAAGLVPGPTLEAWAAGAAIADAAEASHITVAQILVAAPIAGGAPTVAQAAAEAGAGAAPVAHAAPVGNSSAQAAVATGQVVATRETVGWGREAARQVLVALAPAADPNMPPVAAPLPPPAGYGVLVPGVAAPPAGLAAAVAVVGAAAPGGAALVNNIQAGAAPVNAAERWILLTGDMSFSMMPSQIVAAGPAAWPVVVGMTATHHGANTCFANIAARSYVPFAPGTPAAYAAVAAAAAAAIPLPIGAETAAAAAGYVAAEVAMHIDEVPMSAYLPVAQIAAAAVAANGAGSSGAALVAMQGAGGGAFGVNAAATYLTGLGATVQAALAAAAGNSAPAIVAVLAAELVSAQLGAGMTAVIAQACAVGAAALPGLGGGAAAVAASLPGVAATLGLPGVVAAAGAVPAGAAAVAAAGLTPSDWRRASVIVAFTAGLADATGAIAAAPANPASATAVAARAATTQLIADGLLLAAAAPALPAGSLPAAALPPAQTFWPHGGAAIPGLPIGLTVAPAAAVQAAIEADAAAMAAAAARIAAAATAAAPLSKGPCIAYSYGVRNTPGNYRHYYGAVNTRHPHPSAVWTYVGRGWTSRRNLSVNAWHSAQPHPQTAGLPVFVSGGPAAMGWEVAPPYQGPVRGDGGGGVFDRATCALCGNLHFVVC